jgi:hypothetical protein
VPPVAVVVIELPGEPPLRSAVPGGAEPFAAGRSDGASMGGARGHSTGSDEKHTERECPVAGRARNCLETGEEAEAASHMRCGLASARDPFTSPSGFRDPRSEGHPPAISPESTVLPRCPRSAPWSRPATPRS